MAGRVWSEGRGRREPRPGTRAFRCAGGALFPAAAQVSGARGWAHVTAAGQGGVRVFQADFLGALLRPHLRLPRGAAGRGAQVLPRGAAGRGLRCAAGEPLRPRGVSRGRGEPHGVSAASGVGGGAGNLRARGIGPFLLPAPPHSPWAEEDEGD